MWSRVQPSPAGRKRPDGDGSIFGEVFEESRWQITRRVQIWDRIDFAREGINPSPTVVSCISVRGRTRPMNSARVNFHFVGEGFIPPQRLFQLGEDSDQLFDTGC